MSLQTAPLELEESEVRGALLVRALEEEGDSRLGDGLVEAAAKAVADEESPSRRLAARTSFLLERLPRRVQAAANVALPPGLVAAGLCACVLIMGLLSATLGPAGRVNAIVNPVTGVILWNVVVYLAWGIGRLFLLARGSEPTRPGLLSGAVGRLSLFAARSADWGAAKLGDPGAEETALAVRSRYASSYAAVCSAPIAARVKGLLSVSSIVFAVATVAGMYLRGIVYEYHVEWSSTLVPSPSDRVDLARLLFAPAALVLGDAFPSAAAAGEMSTARGAPAAIWFHIYAISCLVYVGVPRSVAAWRSALRARRLGAAIALDPADRYWGQALRTPRELGPQRFEHRILSRFALDAAGSSLLATLQNDLIQADLRQAPPRSWLGGSPLDRKKAWHREWRRIVSEGFREFPKGERPAVLELDAAALGDLAQRVREGPNSFAPDLVLLELAAFEAYWPFSRGQLRWYSRLRRPPRLDAGIRSEKLAAASLLLGRPGDYATGLRKQLGAVDRSLSGFWKTALAGAFVGTAVGALTFGIAAPFVAGLVSQALGIVGAAAMNAGLAAIGGGAIAAAGLGVAEGTAVLVGGGALLGGLGAGSGAASLSAAASRATMLISCTKIEVFLREVVLGQHEDRETFREVFDELLAARDRLAESLEAFRLRDDVGSREVKEREDAAAILSQVTARCEQLRA